MRLMTAVNSNLTTHAIERIHERTKLWTTDIVKIINAEAFVNLGINPEKPQFQHLLFYSTVDLQHYVIVQDVVNHDIITIWPSDYHTNLAWQITTAQKRAAILFTPKINLILKLPTILVKIGITYQSSAGFQKNTPIIVRPFDYVETELDIRRSLNNLIIANKAFKKGILAVNIISTFVKIGTNLPKYFSYPYENDESSMCYFSENKY